MSTFFGGILCRFCVEGILGKNGIPLDPPHTTSTQNPAWKEGQSCRRKIHHLLLNPVDASTDNMKKLL
jgi:hypothetical protein